MRPSVVVVLALAMALRLIGITYDYPFLFEVDELRVSYILSHMLGAHSLDPHFYAYGPFLIYLESLWLLPYLAVRMLLGHHGVPQVIAYDSWTGTISDPLMHLYERLLMVALGVGAVWLAYLVGRRLAGPWAGLLAATLLALSPLHIYQSHFVLPNAPTSFFALLATLFTLRYLQQPQDAERIHAGRLDRLSRRLMGLPLDIVVSAIAAALGAAIKYNAVVTLLIPLLAVYLRYRSNGISAWLKPCLRLCIVAVITFLIVTPPAIFDPVAFVHGAGYELKHYASIGGAGTDGGPSILWYGGYLIEQEGLLVFPLAVVGLAVLAWRGRRPVDILLLGAIVAYYLLIGVQKVHFDRNLLVILPLLSVGCAYTIAQLARLWRPWGLLAALALAAVALLSLAQGTIQQAQAFLSPSPQLVTRAWLQHHLPRHAVLAVDAYTVPPLDRPDVATVYILGRNLTTDMLWQEGVRYVALSKSIYDYQGPAPSLLSRDTMLIPLYSDGGIVVYKLIHIKR